MNKFKSKLSAVLVIVVFTMQLVSAGSIVNLAHGEDLISQPQEEVVASSDVSLADDSVSAPVEEPAPVVESVPTEESVTAEESISSEEVVFIELTSAEESAPVEEQASVDSADSSVATTDDASVQLSTETSSDTSNSENLSASLVTPELSTDKADYEPGETASIFGKFFDSLQNFVLRIFGNSEVGNHYTETSVEVSSDESGSFVYEYQLDNMYRPLYTVVASTLSGVELASMTFTDAAGAAGDLDQCSNGTVPSPNSCTGSAWQNGNLNQNQAHYAEGDSAPYRIRLTNVPTIGTNTLVLEYDIKHSGKHALDYLTTYNRTETDADPCSGVSPCSGSGTTYAIPTPSSASSPVSGMPTDSFNALPSAEKNMTAWNASISSLTYASEGDLNVAQSATRITITFTASDSNVVFAWGGHIGSQNDWGAGNSAGGINGSPYHMRFIELNGKGGNQDRSLSAGAIIAPVLTGLISGQKFNDLNGNGANDSEPGLSGWVITLTNGTSSVSTSTDSNGNYSFSGLADGSYTVCETLVSGWTQTYPSSGTSCAGSTFGYSPVISGGNTVPAQDFGNTQTAKLTVTKVVINDNGGQLQISDFLLFVDTTGVTSGVQNSFNAGTYIVSETGQIGYSGTISGDCASNGLVTLNPGDVKSCTITNNDIQPKLTVTKVVVNDNGGQLQISDFPLFVGATGVTSGVQNGFDAGTYTVSETPQTGYAFVGITGDCASNGSITLNLGDVKACTITNNDEQAYIKVVKVVTNDNGG
ncbi:MAG: SdrD B-like domain-containing protein, partial [bacterium]|nr:SdrD B-like domain-containing protein [bacterium]